MKLKQRSFLSKIILCAAIGVMAGAPLRAQSGACQQIRAACRNAGFVQGSPIGERLVLDCFNPIALGEMPKRPATRALPKIDPQVASACRDSLNGRSASASAQAPAADESTLTAAADGRTVHDSRLGVTWLADANLAAKETFGVASINKSGSMNYETAVRWVAAMNAFNNGVGYLGHKNWQLPTAPGTDKTCELTGRNGEPFGYHCSGSALGSLYYVSLGLKEPDSAVANAENQVGPFRNFQAYLYWSKSAAIDPKQGFVSFSFASGFQGANVFRNYLYVLPMFKGKMPGMSPTSDINWQSDETGSILYDSTADISWLADANLAATQTFGIADISRDGSMDHETALRWVQAMNTADGGKGYLGHTNWDLPETGGPDPTCSMKGVTGFGCTGSALGALFYRQLGFHPGDSVIPPSETKVGPFYNVQPYLYWACSGDSASLPCRPNGPADGFEWNFSLGNGFQGTNLVGNNLFVMVYYPDASAGQSAPNP
jgi:hypothetical protein